MTIYTAFPDECLKNARNTEVSVATLSHTLAHLSLTLKSVQVEAAKCNNELQRTWRAFMGQFEKPEDFLFLE